MAAPTGITWGSVQGGYGRIGIYANVTSTNTQTTVDVEVWFWSKYSVSDTGNTYYYDNKASSGSATTNRGSISISTSVDSGEGWSTSNQQKLGSSSYTYNRGTSAVTRYLYAKLTNIDRVGAAMTASRTVTIPKLASYTISYNANGGSGAPSSQTKWYGKSLTLSTIKPTRSGYSFQGWATSAGGSVSYAPGGSYTSNSAITLYAVWKANTYTVKYDANGGSGAPSNQTKVYGVTLKLSSTKPVRANYIFKGWGLSATAVTVSYAAGANYTKNAGITLYAIWELSYVKPRISNLSIVRCDSSGTANDMGQNGLIGFDWECDLSVSTVIIKWKLPSESTWISDTVSASGTSGTISHVIGTDTLSNELSYDIHITVSDNSGSSYAKGTLSSMTCAIDVLPEDRGIAFGKTAELDGVAEFEFEGKFNSPVYGKALGMDRLPAVPSNSDLNDYIDPGCYAVQSNAVASSCTNIPVARAGRLEVWSSTGEGVRSEQWSYIRQRYVPYNMGNAVWERDVSRGQNNVWSYGNWWRSTLTPDASEKVYHEQKILWQGGMYMSGSQTASLSEPISSQANGIVLVFSRYSASTVHNYHFNTFFIPKIQVATHGGCGHTFLLTTDGAFGVVATKYLYIHDTQIVGNSINESSGTASGITYNNGGFVLRYVYGV